MKRKISKRKRYKIIYVLNHKQEFIKDMIFMYRRMMIKRYSYRDSPPTVSSIQLVGHTTRIWSFSDVPISNVPFFIITSPFFYSLYTNENFWSKKGT